MADPFSPQVTPEGGRPRSPRPLLAAILSAAFPGAGQWYAGARRRGLVMLTVAAGVAAPVIAVALSLAIDGGPGALTRLSEPFFRHPELILGLLAAQAAVAAFHVWAIADAWRVARLGPWRTARDGSALPSALAPAAVAAAVLAALVVPHAWVAQRALALHELLTFDFSVDRSAGPSTSVPATTTAAADSATTTTVPVTVVTTAPTTAPTTVPTTPATTVAPSTTTTTTEPAPTTTGAPPEPDWYTVALLGGDSGPNRWGVRTDTIIVAAVDRHSSRSALFSVPRNWEDAPFPPGHPAAAPGCSCYPDIINSLYQYGLQHPDLFPGSPNPGATALLTVLEHLLGIGIDDYVLVDLQGFERAIDVLGGIDINVLVAVNDPGHVHPDGSRSDIVFRPGPQHMDGRLALAYARARQQTDDYHRMDRQRCVLEAVTDSADPVTILRRLPELVDVLTDSLVTDIPVSEWPGLVALLDQVDTRATVSVQFVPSAPELAGTGLTYTRNVELVRATVQAALELPLDLAMNTIGVGSLDEACG